jgi:hypothetical protein
MKVRASLKGSCLVRCGASWRGAVAISAHDPATTSRATAAEAAVVAAHAQRCETGVVIKTVVGLGQRFFAGCAAHRRLVVCR